MRRTPTLVALAILLVTSGCGGSDGTSGSEPVASKTPSGSALIDYGDDEVTVARAGDVSKLVGAPADFTSFVVAELRRQQKVKDEACSAKPEIHVARIDPGGWAAGGSFIPRCGGNAMLWAKTAGGWREVWGGQTLPDCDVLEKFRFPAVVAGHECGTKDGRTRRYP
jgi:hypothetical protein